MFLWFPNHCPVLLGCQRQPGFFDDSEESVRAAVRLSDALPVRQLLPIDEQRSEGVRSRCGLEVLLIFVHGDAAFSDRSAVDGVLGHAQSA